MAHKISDACVVCIDCGACEDGCPTGAITAE